MSRKALKRTNLMLDPRYPIERDTIALLQAVPPSGERTAFLRALVLIGYHDLCKGRQQQQQQQQQQEGV